MRRRQAAHAALRLLTLACGALLPNLLYTNTYMSALHVSRCRISGSNLIELALHSAMCHTGGGDEARLTAREMHTESVTVISVCLSLTHTQITVEWRSLAGPPPPRRARGVRVSPR